MAVTVTVGKTHIKNCRLIVEGVNLSGNSRSIGSVGLVSAPTEVSGWVEVMENLKGEKTLNFGSYEAIFSNTPVGVGQDQGSHTFLSTDLSDVYGTFAIGIKAPPAIGDPAFSASFSEFSYLVNGATGSAVTISSDFQAGENVVAGWGNLLAAGVEVDSTISLDSFDNGVAGLPNGAIYIFHITQGTGDLAPNNFDITIEESTDDSIFTTVDTVTGVGSTLANGILSSNGNPVSQFSRVTVTKTAGNNFKLWVVQIPLI